MARIKSRPSADADTPVAPSNAYSLAPVSVWRNRVRDYTPLFGEENQAKLDDLRDVVYGMALEGANEKDVSEFFGFEPHLVKQQLGPVIKMAQAELRLILKKDQVDSALASKLPLMKIWAGKQFADQRDEVALSGSESDGEGTGLLITVVKANRSETGRTLDEPSKTVITPDQSSA